MLVLDLDVDVPGRAQVDSLDVGGVVDHAAHARACDYGRVEHGVEVATNTQLFLPLLNGTIFNGQDVPCCRHLPPGRNHRGAVETAGASERESRPEAPRRVEPRARVSAPLRAAAHVRGGSPRLLASDSCLVSNGPMLPLRARLRGHRQPPSRLPAHPQQARPRPQGHEARFLEGTPQPGGARREPQTYQRRLHSTRARR